MTSRGRDGRYVVALLVILAIVLISLDLSGRWRGDFLHAAAVRCVSPAQRAFHWTVDSWLRLVHQYIALVGVYRENEKLLQEMKRLRMENDVLREYEHEVSRLRRLLLFKEKVKAEMIPAEVIAYSPEASFRTATINKGERDRVVKGMPAVTWEGVVGRVLHSTKEASRILLIIDRNSSIDVLVQRTRTRGILEGEGGAVCHLRYVSRQEDLKVGDVLVTSGLSGIFPKGLHVGKIVSVERKDYSLFQEITVEPGVDFSRLEEIFVLVPREGGGTVRWFAK